MRIGRKQVAQVLQQYIPHLHQQKFHQDPHKYRMMVSGVGAGKTRMGVEEAIKWTQIYAGSIGLIGRLNATNLRETTQKRFFEALPRALLEDFNKNEGHAWIKTGKSIKNDWGNPEQVFSEIYFKHMEDAGRQLA